MTKPGLAQPLIEQIDELIPRIEAMDAEQVGRFREHLGRPEIQAELQRSIDETAKPLPPMSLAAELWANVRSLFGRLR